MIYYIISLTHMNHRCDVDQNRSKYKRLHNIRTLYLNFFSSDSVNCIFMIIHNKMLKIIEEIMQI